MTTGNYYTTLNTTIRGRGGYWFYAFDPQMQGYQNPNTTGGDNKIYGFCGNITTGTDASGVNWNDAAKAQRRFESIRFADDGRLFAMNSVLGHSCQGIWEIPTATVPHMNGGAIHQASTCGYALDTYGGFKNLFVAASLGTPVATAGEAAIIKT